MIYVMSGPQAEKDALNIPTLIAIAKEKGVPILVDAAAEEPLNPNPHLSRGATLVCYSGGKCLRGPQSSGVLLGDKNLCQAAYYQAAPHHAYGRALKCSKEEIHGPAGGSPAMVQARPSPPSSACGFPGCRTSKSG